MAFCVAFAIGILASGPQVGNLDDRDVLQTALLALVHEWNGGERLSARYYVILGTQFKESKRRGFGELLDREVKQAREDVSSSTIYSNHPPLNRSDLKMLMALKERGFPETYKCPSVQALTDYSWDRHIVLAVPAAYRKGAKPRLKEEAGYLSPYPPSYSPDGNFCIVDIIWPWGRWMTETDTVLLKRLKGCWTVTYMSLFRPL